MRLCRAAPPLMQCNTTAAPATLMPPPQQWQPLQRRACCCIAALVAPASGASQCRQASTSVAWHHQRHDARAALCRRRFIVAPVTAASQHMGPAGAAPCQHRAWQKLQCSTDDTRRSFVAAPWQQRAGCFAVPAAGVMLWLQRWLSRDVVLQHLPPPVRTTGCSAHGHTRSDAALQHPPPMRSVGVQCRGLCNGNGGDGASLQKPVVVAHGGGSSGGRRPCWYRERDERKGSGDGRPLQR